MVIFCVLSKYVSRAMGSQQFTYFVSIAIIASSIVIKGAFD